MAPTMMSPLRSPCLRTMDSDTYTSLGPAGSRWCGRRRSCRARPAHQRWAPARRPRPPRPRPRAGGCCPGCRVGRGCCGRDPTPPPVATTAVVVTARTTAVAGVAAVVALLLTRLVLPAAVLASVVALLVLPLLFGLLASTLLRLPVPPFVGAVGPGLARDLADGPGDDPAGRPPAVLAAPPFAGAVRVRVRSGCEGSSAASEREVHPQRERCRRAAGARFHRRNQPRNQGDELWGRSASLLEAALPPPPPLLPPF